jgi:tetratricopeptide (TPR) repeat protein
VHRVLQPSGVRSRLERAPGLTPFVGRAQELGLLLERFERAQEGQGQAVLLGGEAGIGKSQLVRELRERLCDTPHSWLECQTSPYTQGSALYPLIAMLEGALAFREKDSDDEKLTRLERGLAYAGLELNETVPLLASLLSLRLPERYAPLEVSPQLQRQKTLEALLAWLLALSEKQPLVLVVEDLHWIDPSTLEWLGLAIGQCPTARLLLLLTHRPEFEPPWPARGHVLALGLDRLGRRDSKELAARATADAPLPESVVAQIASRSDGVPLFVEELTKGVVEVGHTDDHEIPETLQDSLMARLDRLGEAKPVAQHAAAIGREFPYALLAAVTPMTEPALREGLGRLVEAELVYPRGVLPKATYTFKHALLQDTAYQSLLESQRKELHGRIADALEARFAERVAREPEVMAQHCEPAGRTAEAIGHYQRAGERASERSAHAEASQHLQKAIELLRTVPESPERDRREVPLQIALGAASQAVLGLGSPKVENAYERARSLSRRSGDSPERFQALAGLAIYYRNRDLEHALELGQELLAHAERTNDPSQLLFAHSTLGLTLHYRGEFSNAFTHEESAIALYDAIEHGSLESVFGLDPGITSLCLASLTQLQLGHPDRALERVETAIDEARALAHPHSLAYALNWGSIVHTGRGEPHRVLERSEEAIEISRARGLSLQLGGALQLRASALPFVAGAGVAGRALDQVLENVWPQLANTGLISPVAAPFFSAIADTLRRLDRLDDALRVLDSWLGVSSAKHAPYWDAEMLRLRGEILLAQRPAAHEEAERALLRAVVIARGQDGKSHQLRAATSLARLLRDQDRREEARALLQPVYDWFTEGFDTADLKDARALLQDLS